MRTQESFTSVKALRFMAEPPAPRSGGGPTATCFGCNETLSVVCACGAPRRAGAESSSQRPMRTPAKPCAMPDDAWSAYWESFSLLGPVARWPLAGLAGPLAGLAGLAGRAGWQGWQETLDGGARGCFTSPIARGE